VTIGVIVANQVMLARERKRTRDMQMAFAQPSDGPAPAGTLHPVAVRNAMSRSSAT